MKSVTFFASLANNFSIVTPAVVAAVPSHKDLPVQSDIAAAAIAAAVIAAVMHLAAEVGPRRRLTLVVVATSLKGETKWG